MTTVRKEEQPPAAVGRLVEVARIAVNNGGRRAVVRLIDALRRDFALDAHHAVECLSPLVQLATPKNRRPGPDPVQALMKGQSLSDGQKQALALIQEMWWDAEKRESAGGMNYDGGGGGVAEPLVARQFDAVMGALYHQELFVPWRSLVMGTECRTRLPRGEMDLGRRIGEAFREVIIGRRGTGGLERSWGLPQGTLVGDIAWGCDAFNQIASSAGRRGLLDPKGRRDANQSPDSCGAAPVAR